MFKQVFHRVNYTFVPSEGIKSIVSFFINSHGVAILEKTPYQAQCPFLADPCDETFPFRFEMDGTFQTI